MSVSYNLSVASLDGLKQGEIHIWKINVDEFSEISVNQHLNILTGNERARASGFKFYKDRKNFIISRAILRKLSGQYLRTDPKGISFFSEKYGKPQLKHDTTLKFNLSHSGKMIVIGFINHYDIGVDVEHIRNDFDTMDIAKHFFSKQEIKALYTTSYSEKHLAFYRCWTRKEAFIKALGNGLSYPLDSFSVSLDNDHEVQLESILDKSHDEKNWNLFSFRPNDNYIAAIAINHGSHPHEVVNQRQIKHWDYICTTRVSN